nr:hypothetical protein [uncultured Carboxylicivirga sp.]
MTKVKQLALSILIGLEKLLKIAINKVESALLKKDEILSLLPKDNIPKNDEYINTLKCILNKRDRIKNIAISGPYGSGKTSIIQSFKKHYPEFNYLDISLAYFTDEQIDEHGNIKKKILTTEQLEDSILKQIIHRVDKRKLPDSKFDRIRHLPGQSITLFITGIILWSWSFLGLFYPNLLSKINLIHEESWFKFIHSNEPLINLFRIIVFIIGNSIFLWKSIRFLNRINIKKLNLKNGNGSIEIDNGSEGSILNQYLDEIIYFFQKTKFNVVIFEDLDRFMNISIFSKLREINFLINQSSSIKHDVVFIYALKDDLFTNGERTKFFDYIIPIIPIINSSNSESKFCNYLETIEDVEFDDEFKELVSDLSLYVKEMRVLINILNEFDIIRKKLKREELKLCKLFAFVVYKNVYPSDFANLYSDQSIINKILASKKLWAKSLSQNKLEKIEKLRDQIQRKKDQTQQSTNELRMIYLCKFYELLHIQNRPIFNFNIEGETISKSEIIQSKNFNRFKDQTNIQFGYNPHDNNYKQNSGISFKQIEDNIDPEQSYADKEDLIKLNVDALTDEINKLNGQIEEIEQWNINEFMVEDSIKGEFKKLEIPPLLTYLLKNGYIDESYTSYISFFIEGGITKGDNDFIHSVKEQNPLPFNYKLTSPEAILKKIWPRDFKEYSSLNINLIDYLIEFDSNSNRKRFNILLKQLSDGESLHLSFINTYIEAGKYSGLFIRYLTPVFNDLWNMIFIRNEFPNRNKNLVFELMLEHCSTIDIVNQNANDSVRQYIIGKTDFLNYYEKSNLIDKVKNLIKLLNIKFKKLDPHKTNEHSLFDFIDKFNYYEINLSMIKYILEGYNAPLDNFELANYSCIKNSNTENLINYIDNNLDTYIENVHFRLDDSTNEELEFLEFLFNSESLINEHKFYLIKKCHSKCNLQQMPKTFWSALMEDNKVNATWKNLLLVTQEHKIYHKPIIKFLNNLKNMDCLLNSIPEVASDDYIGLFKSILTSNNLEDNIHKAYSEKLNVKITEEEKETINKVKAYNLIKNHRLVYSFEMYEGFKKGYDNDVHLKFIVEYIEDYISNYEDDILEVKDYIKLIDMLPNTAHKESFIEKIPNEIIQKSIELSDSIRDYYILKKVKTLSYDRFFTLADKNTDNNKLLKLFNLVIEGYNLRQINLLLNKLPKPWNTILMRRQIKIENTPLNAKTIESLTNKGIISSYKSNEKYIIGFIKISNIHSIF